MPNYIAAIAGDNFGIQDDNDQNVVNLDRREPGRPAGGHHISWGAYMETLPDNKLDRFGPSGERHRRSRCTPRSTTRSCCSTTSRTTRPGWPRCKDYSRLAADLNATTRRSSSGSARTSATTCTAASTTTCPGHPETPCPYGSTKDDANDAALKQKADGFVKQRGAHHPQLQGLDEALGDRDRHRRERLHRQQARPVAGRARPAAATRRTSRRVTRGSATGGRAGRTAEG